MARSAFYRVRVDLVDRVGADAAFLYAVLDSISRMRKKDEHGYFTVWTKYLAEKTGWGKPRVIKVRGQLMELGLLDFIAGKNQNVGGRYKML